MSTTTYPIRVDARLDPQLGRRLWLVKWLLVIPHAIVLAFLWIAFLVLTVVAFFAVLVTGRYPRTIFDFNVGVMRWSWRVSFYAYGTLGTDRYPPFTLAEVPDYPAHLEIEYPEQLSRGLVLVKWWLLALPHYVVLGFFIGAGGWAVGRIDGDAWTWGSGLVGLLVLFAGAVLLFTGRYPRSLFDFILGMNRWTLRVAACAALMSDAYPPFRLDMGGDDPATADLRKTTAPEGATGTATLEPPNATPPPAAPTGGWSAGRVVALVAGCVLTIGGLGALGAGIAGVGADQLLRDDDGYVSTGSVSLTTDTYALTSESIDLHTGGVDWLSNEILGEVRIEVAAEEPVFVGVARTADVSRYLDQVEHAVVTDIDGTRASYRQLSGGPPEAAPATQSFWAAQDTDAEAAELRWTIEEGDWTVAVMAADGGRGLDVEGDVGATLPVLDWLPVVLIVAGAAVLLLGAALCVVAVSRAARAGVPAP